MLENGLIHPEEATNQVLSLLEDFKNQADITTEPSQSKTSWIAPNFGTLKLNVDGVIFAKQQHARVGCVLRNDKGRLSWWPQILNRVL